MVDMEAIPPTHLSLGAHLCQEDGACLMEAVSWSAGEEWSDAPRCTHPLVAHLARLVNDASSDTARQHLRQYVPALAAAHGYDGRSYALVVMACGQVASGYRPTVGLVLAERAAHRQLHSEAEQPASRWSAQIRGLRRTVYRRGPAHRAVEAAVNATAHLPTATRDEALAQLLQAALAALPTAPGSVRTDADAPRSRRGLPGAPRTAFPTTADRQA